jgi:hypothetical protein
MIRSKHEIDLEERLIGVQNQDNTDLEEMPSYH